MQTVWQNILVIFCSLFSRLSTSSRILSKTRCLNSLPFHTSAPRAAPDLVWKEGCTQIHHWCSAGSSGPGVHLWGSQCTVWGGRIYFKNDLPTNNGQVIWSSRISLSCRSPRLKSGMQSSKSLTPEGSVLPELTDTREIKRK